MSTGFRIFILTLAAFGAIAIYRFRSPELSVWLRQAPPRGSGPEAAPLISPVDRVLGPDAALATLWLRGKEAAEPGGDAGEMEPAAAPLSEQDILSTADLPVMEEEPGGPEGGPEQGSGEREGAPLPEDGAAQQEDPPTPPRVTAFDEIAYEVKDGDNLWRIAARFLGSGSRFQEIRDLNKDAFKERSSDVVPVGTVLKIRVPASREGLKVPGPQADTSVEGSPAPAPPSGREDRKGVYHTVRRSETLQRIAHQYFPEDADGWRTIFAANKDRLASPDLVREGQVLAIPPH
jgi:nucleoid-associated protein YgaU